MGCNITKQKGKEKTQDFPEIENMINQYMIDNQSRFTIQKNPIVQRRKESKDLKTYTITNRKLTL